LKKISQPEGRHSKRIDTPSTLVEFAHGRLSIDESLEILDRLEQNPELSMDLDLIVHLLNAAADSQSDLFMADSKTHKSLFYTIKMELASNARRRILLGASLVLALLFFLVAKLELPNLHLPNKFDEFTTINRATFDWNVRGGNGSSDLVTAYQLFADGKFEKSIDLLNRCAKSNSHNKIAAYAHYEAGAIYLLAARRSLFSVLATQDDDLINDGLQHLSMAIYLGSDRSLLEETYLLKAKAFLMLVKTDSALIQLDSLRVLNGIHKAEANAVIKRIHSLTPP